MESVEPKNDLDLIEILFIAQYNVVSKTHSNCVKNREIIIWIIFTPKSGYEFSWCKLSWMLWNDMIYSLEEMHHIMCASNKAPDAVYPLNRIFNRRNLLSRRKKIRTKDERCFKTIIAECRRIKFAFRLTYATTKTHFEIIIIIASEMWAMRRLLRLRVVLCRRFT